MTDDAATPRRRVGSSRTAAGAASLRCPRRRGQSIVEYSVLLLLVLGALGGMQTYVRRGLQARMRDAAAEDTGTGSFAVPQYDPYYAIATGGFRSEVTARYQFSPGGDVHDVDPAEGTRFISYPFCKQGVGCPVQTTEAPK